jgi:hypothetical protein
MSTKIYNRLLVLFFALNGLVWLPWGIICLFAPQAWSGQVIPGMEVFDLASATARTEVRAMYGGLQMAIGLLALIAILKPRHRDTALLFYVLALGGLALSRLYGLVLEHSEHILLFSLTVTKETYNPIGLAMYELPNFIFAAILLVIRHFFIRDKR